MGLGVFQGNGLTGIVDVGHNELMRDTARAFSMAINGPEFSRLVLLWAKSTEGVSGAGSEDPSLAPFILGARASNTIAGVYAFLNGNHPGKDQADHFLDHTDDTVGLQGLLMFADWENPSGGSPKAPVATVLEFLDRCEERTDVRPLFYGFTSELHAPEIIGAPRLAEGELFQSQFGEAPSTILRPWTKPPRFWQYTNTSAGPQDQRRFPRSTPGFLRCDRSYFDGSYQDLQEWASRNMVPGLKPRT